MAEAASPSLLRILVSTDNHLGVWEKDEIRRDDSFRAFEEVLQTATSLNVDFVLLGGDLFHENKPSRSTLVKAIRIFSKYCLNDKPVSFKILSDQRTNFEAGRVNFADPNLNVGLPVLTIHGNHDDPSGPDNLSAVDILSSCNLVNYFGKLPISGSGVGSVTISPVLIQKGTTRLALYGLGNVRDERLFRSWQTPGEVKWVRPGASDIADVDDWINVLVLHQNRVQHGAFAKNCIQEQQLPYFLDLAIWGHEHECRADAEDIPDPSGQAPEDKRRCIVQPGSSVATALSEGEAKRKHMVLLELLGDKYRTVKYPLHSVRPFLYDRVALRDVRPLLPTDDPEAVQVFLEDKVNLMISKAAAEYPVVPETPPLLPVIRLRVNYTGYSTINTQRFGQKYVGKLANPHDVLDMHKDPVKRVKADGKDEEAMAAASLRPDALDQMRIEDLIAENLAADMQVLKHEELANALHEYVDKDNKSALHDMVASALAVTQAQAVQDTSIELDDMEGEILKKARSRKVVTQEDTDELMQRAARAAGTSVSRGDGGDNIEDEDAGHGGTVGGGRGAGPSSKAPSKSAAAGAKARGGRAPKGAKAAAGTVAATPEPTQSNNLRQANLAEAFGRKGKAAATSPNTQGTVQGGRKGRGKAAASMDMESDGIEDDNEPGPSTSSRPAASGRAATAGVAGRPSRSAAARGTKRSLAESDDDAVAVSDEEEEYRANDEVEDPDDAMDEDVIEDSPPPTAAATGRTGRGAGGGGRKPAATKAAGRATAGSGQKRPRGKAAGTAAGSAATPHPDSVYVDDSDDDKPPPSRTLPTAASGLAAPSGRKRPAFLAQASAPTTSQRTAGTARDWGPARK